MLCASGGDEIHLLGRNTFGVYGLQTQIFPSKQLLLALDHNVKNPKRGLTQ